jgi:hypothetical protein
MGYVEQPDGRDPERSRRGCDFRSCFFKLRDRGDTERRLHDKDFENHQPNVDGIEPTKKGRMS